MALGRILVHSSSVLTMKLTAAFWNVALAVELTLASGQSGCASLTSLIDSSL